jgi:sulfate permease, SulP family
MSAHSRPPALQRWLGPWVAEVNARTLRGDAVAALLAAVLVLPQGLAFAALAGLPPAWGLYAAVVPTAVAALAGSSWHVLTGPTNALSLALAAALAPLAAVGSAEYLRLALVLTLMVGAIQLAVALLRLGVLTHFISPSVLLGFTTGAALLIAWHALHSLTRDHGAPGPALGVGALTLALAVLLRWRWRRGPGMLIALVAGTALGAAGEQGGLWAAGQLVRIGTLPQALPPLSLPAVVWADLPRLATIALALTLVALGQSIAIAKALAARSGQALDVNRECLGQGLANLAGGCFSAFVSCGSLNRSVPHMEAGARTPLAGVMAAAFVLLLVAVAAPLLAWVPMAAIDALLLLVAWTLVDTPQWRELARLDRSEAAVAGGTLAATLLLPLQVAVLAGVAASLVLYLHRTSHPALRTMGFAGPPQPGLHRPFVVLEPGATLATAATAANAVNAATVAPAMPECPQLKLLRMEGPVWFGAEAHVADALRALRDAPDAPRHLLVMGKSMNFIDPAGAALWERERALRSGPGAGLYFHRPRPEVLDTWRRSGFVQRLGEDHIFRDKRSAIAAIVPRLDPAICARCTARVFDECAGQPAPATSRPG